jgi:Family of unknown function (DUF6090)
MAEQEVIKHTKKIYKIWNSNEHRFWQKLKEFFLEVFIIVFAVSVSIWFHNRSEHSHQQEEVKHFLVGLKSDLKNDLEEMRSDKESYQIQKAAFSYITNIKLGQNLEIDSLRKYNNWLFNTTWLEPNNGRFEGFKSSGKIGEIENEELQNDIMDLYQEDIVSLLASTDSYITNKKRFFDYVSKNRKRLTDSTSNISTILAYDEAQNICSALGAPFEVLQRYDKCIDKMQKIIAEINEEYNLKD